MVDAEQNEEGREDVCRAAEAGKQCEGVEQESGDHVNLCAAIRDLGPAYTAATETACQDLSFRGDWYNHETPAAPEEAISNSESADKTSSAVKRATLTMRPIHVVGEGRSEKRGRSSGA